MTPSHRLHNSETRVSYRYHMAVSPLDGSVYVSDPEAHQVLRIGVMAGDLLPVVVVGSGQRCLPGDKNRCGDGGQAIHARLTYPKGEHRVEVFIVTSTSSRYLFYQFCVSLTCSV